MDAQLYCHHQPQPLAAGGLNPIIGGPRPSHSVQGSHLGSLSDINLSVVDHDNEEDFALRESYKSEYSLWSMGRCWRNLFSYRNVENYFKCLVYTLTVNILCFLINLWEVYYIVPDDGARWSNDNTLGVISLLSAVLALSNVVLLLRTLFHPKAIYAAAAYALIMGQLVLYICEIIVYFQPDPWFVEPQESSGTLAASAFCSVALLAAQSLGGLIVYRYW